MNNWGEKVSFIFSIADVLRGPYKPNQYGKIVLPMTILRRLDCVLAPTRQKVLDAAAKHKGKAEAAREKILNRVAQQQFHNTSKLDFATLKADPNNIARNLTKYIKSFSPRARDILDHFSFGEHIEKLDKANRLYLVVKKFADVDLHPDQVSNQEMGYIFEELIRKYNEDANETAGDHFTPREVIRLMVNLLFAPDGDVLTKRGIVKTMLDPACGTGGMLAVSEEYLKELNPDASLEIFGQDYNPESYAVCGSDMLIKGHSVEHIVFGDCLGDGQSTDGFPKDKFDYLLANPPFGAGLPRINDGSFLFLMHMISKMKRPQDGGTRLGIVFNGSPLFTGDAGSGESNIRRWIIENDWLEAIVALPDQLFYNTGIFTYIWIVTNRKDAGRQGKVQLIDATRFFLKMRKSLGNKRHEIGDGASNGNNGKPDHISDLTRIYGNFRHDETRTFTEEDPITKEPVERERAVSKIFDNEDLGFRKITVERPLRLRFQVTLKAIDLLRGITAFANLATSRKKDKKKKAEEEAAGREHQQAIVTLLESLGPDRVWMDREEFLAYLADAAKAADVKLPAPIKKAIVSATGERDESAAICLDKDGNPEPDTELRDYEYVPLKEDIHEYFDREVLPFVPDAWIDESKRDEQDGEVGIVGYEVPLNRHFYVYEPPQPLEAIEVDMGILEREVISGIRSVVISSHPQVSADHSDLLRPKEAVAPKLYPEYRPSGLEWIGNIPKHWKMRRLKFISCIRNSNVDKKTIEDEIPILLCNYVDVYYHDYITSQIEFMEATATEEEIRRFTLVPGDVLITKDSEMWNDIAVPALVDENLDGVLCGYHLAQIRSDPKQLLGEYLFRAFSSCGIRDQFMVRANGITRYGLSIDAVTGAWFPVPTLDEQAAIALFLRGEVAKINALISGVPEDGNGKGAFSKLASKLAEYRSALITAAVTGKIDVRGATS